jgi:hypothetical protein
MAKIEIVDAGRVRHPIEIARDFVREQAAGEWDDKTIERDAKALARVLNTYGAVCTDLGHEPNVAVEYEG